MKKNLLDPLPKILIAAALIFSFNLISTKNIFGANVEISNLTIRPAGQSAAISWKTNIAATGLVEYGQTRDFGQVVEKNDLVLDHLIYLENLKPETVYYFQVRSQAAGTEQSLSGDQSFKTTKSEDTEAPTVYNVSVIYSGGKIAAITWLTDELSSSEVAYWQDSPQKSQRKTGPSNTLIHEVILTNLNFSRTYGFIVKSKDKAGNEGKSGYLGFSTANADTVDKADLIIFNITVSAEPNQVLLGFETSKPSQVQVRYGEGTLKKTIAYSLPSRINHSFLISGLENNTIYTYQISAKDVTGKTSQTQKLTFRTLVRKQSPNSLIEQSAALYKTSQSPRVFAVINNKKHWLSSALIFENYGFKWSDIAVAPQNFLDSLPPVRLIAAPGDEKVYFLWPEKKLKKWIPNSSVFESYKDNKWQDIFLISQTDLNSFSDVNLVKTSGSDIVWQIDNKNFSKRKFVSRRAFEKQGFDWEKIITVNATELNLYRERGAIEE